MYRRPTKESVLRRFVRRHGQVGTATELLSLIGHRESYGNLRVEEQPHWLEVVAYLLRANPQITVDQIAAELKSRLKDGGERR
jgi:hypothetical protein